MEVVSIFKAICIPATISLSTNLDILKKPSEPGTNKIIPGISITEGLRFIFIPNRLLLIPNNKEAINTAPVFDIKEVPNLKEKYEIQHPIKIHQKSFGFALNNTTNPNGTKIKANHSFQGGSVPQLCIPPGRSIFPSNDSPIPIPIANITKVIKAVVKRLNPAMR